jgi:hypothetical protein
MENPIVLDSKWVNLHSEYIIWYTLVYIFGCSFRSMFFFIAVKKTVLKHIILYVHCINLLIWSPTQLDFFILWFFYDLLWFFKIALGVIWPVFESLGGDIYHFIGWGGDVGFFLLHFW